MKRVLIERKETQHYSKPSNYFEDNNIDLFLNNRFPALAIANNINKEELKLDLDLEDNKTNDDNINMNKQIESKLQSKKNKEIEKDLKEKELERLNYKEKQNNLKQKATKSRSRSRSKSHGRKRRYSRSKSVSSTSSHRKGKNYHSKDRKYDKDYDNKKDKKRRSISRSHSRERSKQQQQEEVEIGKIYNGSVTQVHDYGCFVRLHDIKRKKEGLVYISNIQENRVTNAFDVVQKNQPVKVKVVSINGFKIGLSMKEVNQKTGEEIALVSKRNNIREESVKKLVEPEKPKEKRLFGEMTGIRLYEEEKEARRPIKRMTSPELWEQSRYNTLLIYLYLFTF